MDVPLQAILLKAKEDVYTHLSGGNLSRILGQGYDFSELREYVQGDDIRHISWINSAKLGEPYVKKMHEERELNVAVCAAVDGRFVVGEKRAILAQVLALLGYSSSVGNDSFTFIRVTENALDVHEPTKDFETIRRSIEAMYARELLGTRVAYRTIENLSLPAKSLLFLVGDFLEPVDVSVLAQQHEVIAIMIRDLSEEFPTPSPQSQLMNPRTGQALGQTLSQKAIEQYRAKLLEHDDKLLQHFHQHRIRYVKILRSDEVVSGLSELFFS